MELETYLENFHVTVGAPTQYRPFADRDRERLECRLPAAALGLLKQDGFAHYKRQSLWTCDPDTMTSVRECWLDAFPKAEIFMRTAFGDLVFWDGEYVWTALTHVGAIMFGGEPSWFIGKMLASAPLRQSMGIPGFTDKARKACGPIEADEVYIWVPELALGGTSKTSAIKIGKLDVALDILSQIQPISVQPINRD